MTWFVEELFLRVIASHFEKLFRHIMEYLNIDNVLEFDEKILFSWLITVFLRNVSTKLVMPRESA